MLSRSQIETNIQKSIDDIPQQIIEVEAEIQAIKDELSNMEQGDTSENAGVTSAREGIARANLKLLYLNNKLDIGTKFRYDIKSTFIQEGSFIILYDEGTKVEYSFIVVPSELGNSTIGALSSTTPVARAILGRKVGESVTVNTIEGELRYNIREVS